MYDMINPSFGFPKDYNVSTTTRVANGLDGQGCWWWLRTPGDNHDGYTTVYYEGFVNVVGSLDGYKGGVRPALYINLKSSAWKKGDTIKVGDTTGGITVPLDASTRKAFPVEDDSTEKKTEAPTVAPSKSDTVKAPGKAVISKARNIKGKKLNVKWKKVSGAKGYQVQ